MSFWDYKYGGCTVRERFDNMVGTHASVLGLLVRGAVIAFALRTMACPSEHIYIHPVLWVGMVLFFFFA